MFLQDGDEIRVHSVVMAAASAFIRNKIHDDLSDCVTHTFHSTRLHWFPLKVHLHLATATSLRYRCDVAPKSNQLFWCCIVTPSDCDVAVMSLGNHFVSHLGAMSQRHRRRITVARCKWALMARLNHITQNLNWPT